MNDDEKRALKAELSVAFRPSAPIDRMGLFAGRLNQTDMVINAVLQRGQHVILYGERGVGKTSLAKVLTEILHSAGIRKVNSDTINCDPTDDFSSLWHKAFRELTFKIKMVSGFSTATDEEKNLDAIVPKTVTPDDVRRALSTLKESTIIVFDEFDRIQKPETKMLMADTIKTLSDHSVDTTLLIVGVAQSVSDLIEQHLSIERALVQVPMPRMSRDELMQIISKAIAGTNIQLDDSVVDKIVRLSYGLPHYTHLLSLEAGMASVERGSARIEDEDFTTAVSRIVKAKQTIADTFYAAVSSSYKNSRHKLTLLSCAMSPTDGQGFFQASAVSDTYGRLVQKSCQVSDIQKHLTEFVSEKRGKVLQRQGTQRRFRYRFSNPLVQPYTIIHSLSENLISEAQLWMMDQPFYG